MLSPPLWLATSDPVFKEAMLATAMELIALLEDPVAAEARLLRDAMVEEQSWIQFLIQPHSQTSPSRCHAVEVLRLFLAIGLRSINT